MTASVETATRTDLVQQHVDGALAEMLRERHAVVRPARQVEEPLFSAVELGAIAAIALQLLAQDMPQPPTPGADRRRQVLRAAYTGPRSWQRAGE